MQLEPGQLRGLDRSGCAFDTVGRCGSPLSAAAVRATVEPPRDIVTIGFVLRADEPLLIDGRPFRRRHDMSACRRRRRSPKFRYPAGSRIVTLAMPSARLRFDGRQIRRVQE